MPLHFPVIFFWTTVVAGVGSRWSFLREVLLVGIVAVISVMVREGLRPDGGGG